jgi:hypothetical protein
VRGREERPEVRRVGTYELIHEGIVDDSNDWYALESQSDRSANHRISMDLLSVPHSSHDPDVREEEENIRNW